MVTVEVQVPQRVDGKALDALKKFAEETSSEDVRADFVNKAKLRARRTRTHCQMMMLASM